MKRAGVCPREHDSDLGRGLVLRWLIDWDAGRRLGPTPADKKPLSKQLRGPQSIVGPWSETCAYCVHYDQAPGRPMPGCLPRVVSIRGQVDCLGQALVHRLPSALVIDQVAVWDPFFGRYGISYAFRLRQAQRKTALDWTSVKTMVKFKRLSSD